MSHRKPQWLQTDELEERVQDEMSRKYLEDTRKQMTTAIEQLSSASAERDLNKLKSALNAERKAYEGYYVSEP